MDIWMKFHLLYLIFLLASLISEAAPKYLNHLVYILELLSVMMVLKVDMEVVVPLFDSEKR